MALAIVLSVLIGISLGLLGGGGSILTVPILVYALGVDKKTAIAESLLIVALTSAVALINHARRGNVDWRIGGLFAGSGMVGAWVGGWLAGFISARVLLLLFAGMMVATAIAMLRSRPEEAAPAAVSLRVGKVLLEGTGVGLVTGMIGAGGGFLVVPALNLLGGVPMQRAIGTSLLVITLKSLAAFAGHATHVTVDFGLTALVAGTAAVGSLVGSRMNGLFDAATLRRGFAIFVLAMAAWVIVQEL